LSIHARVIIGTEETKKSTFGSQKGGIKNPFVHLAFFLDGSNVNKAIAESMTQIESAIRTKAEFCDLSQTGDAQAWTKAWQQIQWPKG
jgi:hypothetical protein